MKNKQLGMIIGLHVGDALGATLEFGEANISLSHTEIIGQGPFDWNPGEATDDTDLMMGVLRSVKEGSFNLELCKKEFINWYKTNPKDIGVSTRRGIEQAILGLKPVVRESGQGNGSLMRVAPLALINATQEDVLNQASITHPHPNCILADKIFISLLKLAISGEKKEKIYQESLRLSQGGILEGMIKDIQNLKWEELRTTGFVLDTLTTSIWALMNTSSFEEALINVVNRGDDSDTNGAVTGALCGAYYGIEEIPKRWIKDLQYKKEIEDFFK